MAREIRFVVDDDEHERLKEAKDGRTWHEMMKDGANVDKNND